MLLHSKIASEVSGNNINVYAPARDADGNYHKEIMTIAKKNINVGFVPMTQRNLMNISFTSLGKTSNYWLWQTDDYIYTIKVFKCFGITLPFSDRFIVDRIKLSNYNETDLINYIKKLPIRTLFDFSNSLSGSSGTIMIYIGTITNVPYFITQYTGLGDTTCKVFSIHDLLYDNFIWLSRIGACFEFSSLKLDSSVSPTPTPTGNETFLLTFKSNGGSSVSTQKVTSGKTSKVPANPTKAGYDFVGWYTNSALTKAFNFNSKITANTTLYAKWKVAENSNEIALNKSLKVTQSGSKLSVSYGKVLGATSYKVYAGYSGKTSLVSTSPKTSATVKKLIGKKLDTTKIFQVTVEAYDGDTKLATSIKAFVAGAKNKKFTNTKSVKVAGAVSIGKGKSATLKPKTTLANSKKKKLSTKLAPEFRYASSAPSIATVSPKGKITGKTVGTAIIYVYSRNGMAKAVKVTVK